jgi:hypothetical protein
MLTKKDRKVEEKEKVSHVRGPSVPVTRKQECKEASKNNYYTNIQQVFDFIR